jgi:hypothetical protein
MSASAGAFGENQLTRKNEGEIGNEKNADYHRHGFVGAGC